ncbi:MULTISPECIES: hypothetical protein [Streptomyces]|uniref:hypothetical protein n=1 Tax=Streptomyces TaxID=1883 RepID=UPI0002AD1BD1|nr:MULTISPECIES: hypothetical protein [Streptomyces]
MMKIVWQKQEMPDATVDVGRLEEPARQILVEIGEDPTPAGLLETPRRYAK